MIYLSIIIPAYNEAKRLPKTLKKVRVYLEKQTYTSKVYVVNDGSTDETVAVVSDLIKDWPDFQLISYEKNHGKGYAVKTGMLAAKGEWRLMMDADSSTDISEIEKLLKYITESEIIIGSRYLNSSSIKVKQPWERRVVSRFGNWLTRVLLGLNMVDTQCGFKLFSFKATKDIFPHQTIDHWAFDIEILAIAHKKGYNIKEVPVDWYNAEGSQVSKTAAYKTLQELWQIRKNMRNGKY